MKAKQWLTGWVALSLIPLGILAFLVYRVDPFFHYHAPDTESYFYPLNNERSQNDGIIRHFSYDAVLIGTSMTQNFSASEADALFGVNSIKVPFALGSLREINDNLSTALTSQPEITTVIRAIETSFLADDKDRIAVSYPTYLYDGNPFTDINYLLNGDVLFNRVMRMMAERTEAGFKPGITSFDDYSHWFNPCGIHEATYDGVELNEPGEPVHLTETEMETLRANVRQNVTVLADAYPDVDFYYFYPPFSIIWWQAKVDDGTVYRDMEAIEEAAAMILEHPNIHLYSFDERTDILSDMNNYSDAHHYAWWVNSLILKWIRDGEGLLTEENYRERLAEELRFYTEFDYASLIDQEDYEDDLLAPALLNEELTGAEPILIQRGMRHEVQAELSETRGYQYLVFEGKQLQTDGAGAVTVKDSDGNVLGSLQVEDDGDEWHTHVLRIGTFTGQISVFLNGGDGYRFRMVTLY